tara:strand:- start:286 stop:1305 length:1020 start_codon:yes stop_codon:yes gene_type:complete
VEHDKIYIIFIIKMPFKIIINDVGGPDKLELKEYSLENKKPQPKEVRIKHTSIGVNFIDTYHRSGLYPIKTPSCLGLEAVGEIVGIGGDVQGFSVGDVVGYSAPPLGAYCELRDYPSEKLVKVPKEISENEAASILLKGMTVEYLFNRTYKIKKGETFLFHAAAGGVGLVACQWAKALGCHLIGTVGSDEKGDLARANGCEHVINYKKENVVKKVMSITGNRGVGVVYDGVGKDTFDISLDCLSDRGFFVSFGNASGMTPTTDLFKSFAPKNLYFTRPSLMVYNKTRKELDDSSGLLFEMIIKKKIKTNLTKIYELKDVASAHKDLESRKTVGSLILKP